jgi:hypothetical protein
MARRTPCGPRACSERRNSTQGLGLDLAEIQADRRLAYAGLVHALGNNQGLGAHVAARAHRDVRGVEPQVGIAAFKRALPEGLDLLIERSAERNFDRAVDLARRDAVDVGLEYDGDDRLP